MPRSIIISVTPLGAFSTQIQSKLSFDGESYDGEMEERGTRDAIKAPCFYGFHIHAPISYSSENRTLNRQVRRETREIAIERMTKQKKRKKRKGKNGGDCRRGDPVVINGTLRSMRKHYVIHGEHIHGTKVRVPLKHGCRLFKNH